MKKLMLLILAGLMINTYIQYTTTAPVEFQRMSGSYEESGDYIHSKDEKFLDGGDFVKRTSNGYYYVADVSGYNFPSLGLYRKIHDVEMVNKTVYEEKEGLYEQITKAVTKKVAGDDIGNLILSTIE